MKIILLKKTVNELKFKIEGEGHSFCNVLRKVLLDEKAVEFVGYDVSHPLTAHPVIYLRTMGRRKPEKVLLNAAKRLGNTTEEFRNAFLKAIKSEKT
jgi:DNA-directed RNA polymerase subunit L